MSYNWGRRRNRLQVLASITTEPVANNKNHLGWILRAQILYDMNRLTEAVASYDQALSINPRSLIALENKGLMCELLQDLDQALVCYDNFLSLNPNYAPVWYRRSVIKLRRDDISGCIFDLKQVIKLDKNAVNLVKKRS